MPSAFGQYIADGSTVGLCFDRERGNRFHAACVRSASLVADAAFAHTTFAGPRELDEV